MENLLELGIGVVLFLQSLGDWLQTPMRLFSFLGDEYFFLFFMPIIYWSVDTRLGIRMGILLLTSQGINTALKMLFFGPRPYWFQADVKAYVSESSFGLPSGHSFTAAAVWGGMASYLKKPSVWVLVILTVLLIGISRIYNGVHFPTDVLGGWLFGALLVVVYVLLEKPVENWLKRQNMWVKILTAGAFSLALIGIAALARMAVSSFKIPEWWQQNAFTDFPEEIIDPLSLSGVISPSGTLFGMAVGIILLPKLGGFYAGGEGWKRVVRFMLGLAGVLALYLGLSAVFPTGEELVPSIFRFIRYGFIGFWVTGLAPWVFVKLGLASTHAKKAKKVVKAKRSFAGD